MKTANIRDWQRIFAGKFPRFKGRDLEELHAFLADMVEHPLDSAPLLICGDWLEEHGDPRHQLMRELVPAPAEMSPDGFDGPRVSQHKIIKVAAKPDEVLLPLWGDGSKLLFGSEMKLELDLLGRNRHPVDLHVHGDGPKGVRRTVDCSDRLLQLHGFPCKSVKVLSEGRFRLDFRIRLHKSDGLAINAVLTDNWNLGLMNWGRPELDEFICRGVLRDPCTALIFSLSKLLPEHEVFLMRLLHG